MLATQSMPLVADASNGGPAGGAPPRPRAFGGFVDDDSDDETEAQEPVQEKQDGSPRPAKKRMLEQSPRLGDTAQDSPNDIQDDIPELSEIQEILDDQPDDSIPDAQLQNDLLQSQLLNEEDRYDMLFGAARESILLESETRPINVQTCSGRTIPLRKRTARPAISYESMVAQRSRVKEGRAKRSYYGIDIHELVDGAKKELAEKDKKEKVKRDQLKGKGKETETDTATAADASTTDQPMTDSVEPTTHEADGKKPKKTKRSANSMLWTEKYRARNFMDLVGDDLTNRLVLRWLKRWDQVVFPHMAKTKRLGSGTRRPGGGPGGNASTGPNSSNQPEEEKPHRKILILAGPPGLGKTTLAHVCARQAGYEVLEINASDDRSRDVVNGRIRTSLGTENVKTVDHKASKIARPVCVVVDEVDGVVSGSGASGEGGFVKALMDLVQLDQRNAGGANASTATTSKRRNKKDDFRQMRPLILICNDVYHVSLRPLRQSGLAEIVHVGKPSVDTVVTRLKTIFEKEGIPCEKEAARKICEAAWGMGNGVDVRRGAESTAQGDLRGVMVVGEWVARRLRASAEAASAKAAATATTIATAPATAPAATPPRLTRFWVDQNVLPDLAHGGNGGSGGMGARGLGRGGAREIVTRVFQEGAGFPKSAAAAAMATSPGSSHKRLYRHEQPKEQMNFAEHQYRYASERLREMIDTSGDVDRIINDIFAEYPNREFNDDSYLSKPDAAYEWFHFHDACSRRIFSSQEWELAAYTSQPVLACHQLFSTAKRYDNLVNDYDKEQEVPGPFSGPRADFAAREAEKHNRAALQAIQADLPLSLLRAFRNADDLAADFLPYVLRLVSPDVKPVLVNLGSGAGGNPNGNNSVASVRRESEKVLVKRAAEVLAELGIRLQRGMLEETSTTGRPQWVYRMDPDIDMLSTFETASHLVLASHAPTRYAVRQVLDQELRKTLALRASAARQARFSAGRPLGEDDSSGSSSNNVPVDKENLQSEKQKAQAAKVEAALLELGVKRDFFGRIITNEPKPTKNPLQEGDGNAQRRHGRTKSGAAEQHEDEEGVGTEKTRVWVTFHEGLNNAVRKPISVDDFMRCL